MTKPRRYLMRIALFLVVVAALIGVTFPVVLAAFQNNVFLNSVILGVLAIGILYILRQVVRLGPEVRWLEEFRSDRPVQTVRAPHLLAPMASMLREHEGKRLSLSPAAMRTLLDGIGLRLDEERELSRYLIGLLIFLGLLGTFWGLLQTVNSVGENISRLQVGGDAVATFNQLKESLRSPLVGMGTAFSASMFGLAGSLVLGFMELQANRAQNRFYNDLEEWLSGVTRLPSGALQFDGDQSVPAYVQALLEQTAESLDNLQRIMARSEESRSASNASITVLAERLSGLSDFMRSEQQLLTRLVENSGKGDGMDDATRTHIRNIEIYMARLLEELVTGRTALADELRGEIKLLARALAARSGEQQRVS